MKGNELMTLYCFCLVTVLGLMQQCFKSTWSQYETMQHCGTVLTERNEMLMERFKVLMIGSKLLQEVFKNREAGFISGHYRNIFFVAGIYKCTPTPNSSIIFRQKASRSAGLRLVTSPLSTTTSLSTLVAPAFKMSVR
jgi:hypothetical protein